MLHRYLAQQQQQQRQQYTSSNCSLLDSNVASNTVQQATNNNSNELDDDATVTAQKCIILSAAAAVQKQQPMSTPATKLTANLTETTLLSSKNTHSICLQKNVACSNMLPTILKTKFSTKNATISTTTITTIKTTTARKVMQAQVNFMKLKTAIANKMLLSSSNVANHSSNDATIVAEGNAVTTIDFNSRRRRGRLRCEEQQPLQEQQQQKDVAISKTKPPPLPPLNATTKQKINVVNTSTTFLSSLFRMLLLYQMLLLLLHIASNILLKLKKFITKNVNTLRWQQLYLYVNNKILATSTVDVEAFSYTTPSTFTINNKQHKQQQCKCLQLLATLCSFCCSNSKRRCRLPNYSQLIYVFLLFTTILPCNNNMLLVSAAKPKSATQIHQQQQQQQQQPQQNQNQLQLYNNRFDDVSNFDGSDGVIADTGNELTPPSLTSNEEAEFLFPPSQYEEQNLEKDQSMEMENEYESVGHETSPNNSSNATKTPLFPKDLFTKEQLENGAVVCHILGVIYMFVALAIVCDEFFVPSLDVIIEKMGITDDVAGATFMAAGGSAPELFTSVIGVFVSFDDVGIGTIVGSAVFNILFVIGMCALFSKTVLTLTWWPLFRDCTFYSISLIVLIYFFRDNRIFWWEALILFFIYIAYVLFMKWNVQVERCVKKLITKNKVTRVRSTDQLMPAGNAANSSETSMATQPGGSVTSRAASETRSGPAGGSTSGATGNSSGGTGGSTQTGAKFRHGLLQLMIHTIDPLHDDDVPGKVDEKATQLHAIASLKVLLDATKPQRGGATTSAANHVKINLKETTLADRPNGNIDTTLDSPSLSGRRPSWIEQRVKIQTRKFSIKPAHEIEDEPEPLSMAWPDTGRKRLTYILVAPLLIPMWLTLPDTRTPKGKKYFPITFIGSIVWIAAFSYLMVWWANVAGDTARIPPEVMGLTFLAAGTSIPDLITSVIVARKGFGDMAVSSSVGSNIFDVTVGLPIPWLLYGLIYSAPVEVNSVGMVCSITILFMMLIFVVMSIACFRWKMNKSLGFTMFLLYFVFVAVSLMFEYDMIRCPV